MMGRPRLPTRIADSAGRRGGIDGATSAASCSNMRRNDNRLEVRERS